LRVAREKGICCGDDLRSGRLSGDATFPSLQCVAREGDPSYYARVDTIADGKSRIVQLKVWFLIGRDGHTYWKVGPP